MNLKKKKEINQTNSHLNQLQTLATTISMMYVARTLDAFISIRALVIKSILSKYVNTDELGRSFSIIAIIEAIGKFVFVSLYSVVYENTLETWPAAFYFVSFIFLVLTAILFVYVWALHRCHWVAQSSFNCKIEILWVFFFLLQPFVLHITAKRKVWRGTKGDRRSSRREASRSRRNNTHVIPVPVHFFNDISLYCYVSVLFFIPQSPVLAVFPFFY